MSGPDLILQEGDMPDLDAVMSVMEASFDPRYGEAWTSAQCSGLLALPGVWLTLALAENRAAGFSLGRVVADEAELLLLAVRPELRRRGIGRALLDRFAAVAAGRGADRLHLEVRKGNHAVRMYERAGFSEVGRRKNYYTGSDGQAYDALTLRKNNSETA